MNRHVLARVYDKYKKDQAQVKRQKFIINSILHEANKLVTLVNWRWFAVQDKDLEKMTISKKLEYSEKAMAMLIEQLKATTKRNQDLMEMVRCLKNGEEYKDDSLWPDFDLMAWNEQMAEQKKREPK